MSRKEIQLDLLQCDFEDERSARCENDGDEEIMQKCYVCKQDLCKEHCLITTVTILQAGGNISGNMLQGTRLRFAYYFCDEHSELFRNTVKERYGEGEGIENAGDGTWLL